MMHAFQQDHRIRARRILVVDDDPIVANGIVALLEIEGIESQTVHRGEDARPAIADFRPDAVILDLSLADMSGFDVYRQITSGHPAMPVLFSSGQDDAHVLNQDGFNGAPVGFLLKPYGLDALIEALAKLTAPPR